MLLEYLSILILFAESSSKSFVDLDPKPSKASIEQLSDVAGPSTSIIREQALAIVEPTSISKSQGNQAVESYVKLDIFSFVAIY